MLHLGGARAGGWRNWMDVGTFTSMNTDQMYIGLKNEGAGNWSDRMDAVINWGDNQIGAGAAPDNFRIIFTAPLNSGQTGAGANGAEGLRMTPVNVGIFTGIGGDPLANLYSGGSINPGNYLEVNSYGNITDPGGSSGLRFTDLTSVSPTLNNPGMGVLSVDINGDVIYVPAAGQGIGQVTADNGLTIAPSADNVQWGQVNTSTGALQGGQLLHDTEIPTDGWNISFYGFANPGTDQVSFGQPNNLGYLGTSKIFSYNEVEDASAMFSTDATLFPVAPSGIFPGWIGAAGVITNLDYHEFGIGLYGRAEAVSGGGSIANTMGVYGEGQNGFHNHGVFGRAISDGINNFGGKFEADGAMVNYAVHGYVYPGGGNGP